MNSATTHKCICRKLFELNHSKSGLSQVFFINKLKEITIPTKKLKSSLLVSFLFHIIHTEKNKQNQHEEYVTEQQQKRMLLNMFPSRRQLKGLRVLF